MFNKLSFFLLLITGYNKRKFSIKPWYFPFYFPDKWQPIAITKTIKKILLDVCRKQFINWKHLTIIVRKIWLLIYIMKRKNLLIRLLVNEPIQKIIYRFTVLTFLKITFRSNRNIRNDKFPKRNILSKMVQSFSNIVRIAFYTDSQILNVSASS